MVLTYSPSRLAFDRDQDGLCCLCRYALIQLDADVFNSMSKLKNHLTSLELPLNLSSITAKADIMFFRFERQTLGRPAHAERFAAASSRAEYTVRRRHSEKRPAERAERALTPKRRRNQ
jgi:hypothetical protein